MPTASVFPPVALRREGSRRDNAEKKTVEPDSS